MSKSETGSAGFGPEAAPYGAAIPTELRSLLTTISHQIDEADQRHTNILQELRERLRTLSRDAEQVRTSVPEDAGSAYARIESGLAQLALRIDGIDDAPPETRLARAADAPAPAPLRSAAAGGAAAYAAHGDASRPATAAAIDPFDLVGEPDEDGLGSEWARTDADALTRIYEESDAALVRTSPRSETPAVGPAVDEPRAPEEPVAAAPAPPADPLHIFTPAEPVPPSAQTEGDFDRVWLDQRLSDIAARIEQSLADLKPDLSVASFGLRFDAFEERMGSVLGDVATRTDLESLQLLEGQIHELASHLEQAERQLGRLDSIEQQLQAVIAHLSDSPEEAATGHGAGAATAPDFQALASATAEEVAQRFASALGRGNGEQRFDELSGLLRGLMDDRRQNDEQTYSMLDTVQQAMIRLLDRIDALEISQARAQTPVTASFGPFAESERFPTAAPDQPFAHPAHPVGFVPEPPPYPPMSAAPMPAPPMPAAPVAPSSASDKLRQEYIADAQRAKMRAAAAVDSGAEGATAPRAMRAMPRPKPPAAADRAAEEAALSFGSTRKQRLTAIALCVVIAVSGAALLAKSRKASQPDAPAPAAITETQPDIAVPGPVTEEPAASDRTMPGNAGTQNALPENVLPQSSVPAPDAPATREGIAFESPADDPAEVPAPIPAPNTAPPLSGGELAPQGIILHESGRTPTSLEMASLHFQQNSANLSSRLGSSAASLSPADLMPEEVARIEPRRVSLGFAADEDLVAAPATAASGRTSSALALPPATVGPLSLRLAAANGDPSAAFEVGARLAEGKGTDQNFKEALRWYQKAAGQGFAQAQYRLGTLYERGLGVKADLGRARTWYQRAAEQGNVKAMHNLAVLSAGRETGTPDYTTAAQWFTSAAEYGLADSQYNLAVLYENGLGVPQISTQAYKWYALAAGGGDKEAARRRDALRAQMPESVQVEAEGQVTRFRAKRMAPLVNDPRVAGEDWKSRQERG